MSAYPDSVPGFHLGALLEHLQTQGVPCDALLTANRLSLDALKWPGARVPRSVMASVLMALREETGRSDLGFEMGLHLNLTQTPWLGQLLINSQTLIEGLQRVSPYMPLLTPSIKVQCVQRDVGVDVVCRLIRPMPYDIATMALETCIVSLYRTVQVLLPTQAIEMEARVSWPAPAHASRYAALPHLRIFHQVDLGGMAASLTVLQPWATMLLPKANPVREAALREVCARQLEELQGLQPWSEWIAHILDVVEDHQPSQAELAGLMGISVRTLARHLETEGVSFRRLELLTRHRRACELLARTQVSVAEIARILGYSDSANFSRAFKIAEGQSPLHYRERLRAFG